MRADGRWGGRLTSRALPDDPSIDRLSEEERRVLAEIWVGRAAAERRVADAFVVIDAALAVLGAGAELRALAYRAVDDEMRHAELARVVAVRYAGRELEAPPLLPLDVPLHPRVDERLRHVLHVVGHCCINETIASAFLEAALVETTAPLAATALRELLSDEIDHARIGWALLASLDAMTKTQVGERFPALAIANLRMWRTAPRRYAGGQPFAAHGAPSEALAEAAFALAFRDLVVPGCEQLGLDASRIRAWAAVGMPT